MGGDSTNLRYGCLEHKTLSFILNELKGKITDKDTLIFNIHAHADAKVLKESVVGINFSLNDGPVMWEDFKDNLREIKPALGIINTAICNFDDPELADIDVPNYILLVANSKSPITITDFTKTPFPDIALNQYLEGKDRNNDGVYTLKEFWLNTYEEARKEINKNYPAIRTFAGMSIDTIIINKETPLTLKDGSLLSKIPLFYDKAAINNEELEISNINSEVIPISTRQLGTIFRDEEPIVEFKGLFFIPEVIANFEYAKSVGDGKCKENIFDGKGNFVDVTEKNIETTFTGYTPTLKLSPKIAIGSLNASSKKIYDLAVIYSSLNENFQLKHFPQLDLELGFIMEPRITSWLSAGFASYGNINLSRKKEYKTKIGLELFLETPLAKGTYLKLKGGHKKYQGENILHYDNSTINKINSSYIGLDLILRPTKILFD